MLSFKELFEGFDAAKTAQEHLDMEDLHHSLVKHYNFGEKNLPPYRISYNSYEIPPVKGNKDINALHKYTQGDTYNSYLWQKHKNQISTYSSSTINKSEKDVKNYQMALKKYKTPHDMTVYSASNMDPRTHKNSEGIVHHPAFMSTSINKDFAKSWSLPFYKQHILKIHVPKGSHGAYVEHLTAVPDQHEFILPHGHNLQYHSSEEISWKKSDFHNPKNKPSTPEYTLHHMTLLPENK